MKEVARAIITNEEEKVLLGKRARGIAAGFFALIGGKPEPDESPSEAVIREVREEIGLDFQPLPYLEMIDSSSCPDDPWKVYYFVGTVKGDIHRDPEEVEAIIWVSKDELSGVQIAFDHKERLVEYFKSQSK